jgi:alanine transaminase
MDQQNTEIPSKQNESHEYVRGGQGWGLDMPELRRVVADGKARGLNPKALVIINPGNPVGNPEIRGPKSEIRDL